MSKPTKHELKSSTAAVAPVAPPPPEHHCADDILLRSPAVRQRYRCSDMWIHRRLTDASGFPRPIYIAGIRHWRLSELVAWETAQAERPTPKPRILEHRDRALAVLSGKRAEQKRRKAGAPTSPEI
jgi:predicted DNA-binding transcriptional regulator AlpA